LFTLAASVANAQNEQLKILTAPKQKGVAPTFKRCSTMEVMEEAIRNDPSLPEKMRLEGERQYQLYLDRVQSGQRVDGIQATITIPIVFHLVDVAGTLAGISDRDVLEQVEFLNRDYAGKKMDQYTSVIPALAAARVGRIDIKFVLARRDPLGALTTGIERRANTSPDHVSIKATATGGLDAWDETRYLNVWAGTFSGADAGLLGIATFPFTAGQGAQGVVIGLTTLPIASNLARGYDPEYSEGATLSHEIGHYFYLWHTFGDNATCNNDDFRIQAGWPLPPGAGPEGDDSPMEKGTGNSNFVYGNPSMDYNDGCAIESFGILYGSYMNYFDDRALFMFSDGMRKRVEGCINLYRPGLLTSDGATPPSAVNDAYLVNVSPRGNQEKRAIVVNNTPFQAIVRNSGTTALTTVTLNVSLDGGAPVATVFPLTLATGRDTTLNLAPITAAAGGHLLTVYTSAPNSAADNFLYNDTLKSYTIVYGGIAAFPLTEDFTSATFPPANWGLWNPNGGTATWTRSGTSGSTAAGAAFFDNWNINQVGTFDELLTPALDLGTASGALLNFKVAHAAYSATDVSGWDGLEVYVSGNGGRTFNLVYKKTGPKLATSPVNSATAFTATPAEPTKWRNETITLTPYIVAGQRMIVKFRSTNAFGNNLYLDDISITAPPVAGSRDLEVLSVTPLVRCTPAITPVATVRNKGTETITAFKVSYVIGTGTPATTIVTGVNLAPNATTTVTLPAGTLAAGANNIKVYSWEPTTVSGTGDQALANDTIVRTAYVTSTVQAPTNIVETFEGSFVPAGWALSNPDNGITWQKGIVGKNSTGSTFIRNFVYLATGQKDDLYTPILGFTAVDSVKISFDLAATTKDFEGSSSTGGMDTLEVLLTKDCGNTYTTVYKKWGSQLQTLNVTNYPQPTEFTPSSFLLWRTETIDLTSNAPAGSLQMIFRNTNYNQNNIFIDNVNFRTVVLPPRLKADGVIVTPNPFNSQFNVWYVQPPADLRYITIFNSAGQLVWNKVYSSGSTSNVINIDLTGKAGGVYTVNLGYSDKGKNKQIKVIKAN
jgi:Secretion system C-terminal sorting domain/Pregnancy-associated plasma protein-A